MSHNPTAEDYIRETIADLQGRIDVIAFDVITRLGIFAVDDPAALDEAVNACDPSPEGLTEKTAAAEELAATGRTREEQHRAVLEIETIACDEINRVRDAAYLLGIAVGRRLGPESLRLPAGGVR